MSLGSDHRVPDGNGSLTEVSWPICRIEGQVGTWQFGSWHGVLQLTHMAGHHPYLLLLAVDLQLPSASCDLIDVRSSSFQSPTLTTRVSGLLVVQIVRVVRGQSRPSLAGGCC
jgi:hypothetical protein